MAAGCALLCGRAADGFAAGVLATLDCAAVGRVLGSPCQKVAACAGRGRAIPSSAFPATSAAVRHRRLPVSPMLRTPAPRVFRPRTRTIRSVSGPRFAAIAKTWRAAPLFHQREGARVFNGVAAESHRDVIAAVFAFGADSLVQPPDCGMVEEQRLDADLEDVDKGIEALDVREFVGDDRLKLILGEACESAHWQEHDRAKPSDDRGRLQPRALAVFNGAVDAERSCRL